MNEYKGHGPAYANAWGVIALLFGVFFAGAVLGVVVATINKCGA